MGLALKEHGRFKEAIRAYNKALTIEPNFAEAYNNIGNALKDQSKLKEAIKAYSKALLIKPNYAEAYNDLGITLNVEGRSKDAIKSYKQAIKIKSDFIDAWNNVFFPLQALKTQLGFDKDLSALYPKERKSNYAKIAKSILDYRLHRGQEREEQCFNQVLGHLSKADNRTIQNPTYDKEQAEQIHTLADKMVSLIHFGRSGTGLMHSLIDGHPEVSTLPSIYFSEYFDHSIWTKITSTGWNGMIDRFISIYDVLFDASSSVPVATKSTKLLHNIGIEEGMANVGDQKNEVLRVDKTRFKTELKHLMDCYEELDTSIFFKLVHAAFDKTLNDPNPKSLIFYHIHNPDNYALLNFSRCNPNTKWVMMVREPIQSCESWIRGTYNENDHLGLASQILTMLFEIDNYVYSNQTCIGVRLEDLKEYPHKTIPALCDWMGIEETESLYQMTAQGKKWWGDPSSPDFEKDGMDPFGKTSINRKVGSIFSENDQLILRTLFYPFSVRFGYTEENEAQFKNDLETIRPMLDSLFDFERAIILETEADPGLFMKSGSYLYLRSGLIERWNTLSKFGTYPNMINPLQI